jgi:hypothetical protein
MRQELKFRSCKNPVRKLAFNSAGTTMVAVCSDASIWRWDMKPPLPPPRLPQLQPASHKLPQDQREHGEEKGAQAHQLQPQQPQQQQQQQQHQQPPPPPPPPHQQHANARAEAPQRKKLKKTTSS